jgi:hypothetical protein
VINDCVEFIVVDENITSVHEFLSLLDVILLTESAVKKMSISSSPLPRPSQITHFFLTSRFMLYGGGLF